jgi:hypothetical protein
VNRDPVYWARKPRAAGRASIGAASAGVVLATPKRRPPAAAAIMADSPMPTDAIETRARISASPGSPKAATTSPSHVLSCARAISSTSAADASKAAGSTIIAGARVAVAPTMSQR